MAGEVRVARGHELELLQAIGRDAGERFREIAEPRIARCADDPPIGLGDLAAYQAAGRALAAVEDGEVVGFAVIDVVDGCAHVEEVSVRPGTQGRGHGAALLDAAQAWAIDEGLDAVTLTTFRDVPWNAPYYERRGFRVLDEGDITSGLRARRDDEAAHGLAPELRVVMRREHR